MNSAAIEFSQGGGASASVVIPLSSRSQTFSTRTLAANNPQSRSYRIVARLTLPADAKVTCDGVQLSATDAVISPDVPYGVVQNHSIEIAEGDFAGAAIVLTVTAN